MPEKFEWKTELEDETIIRTHAWSPPGCHPVGCGLQLHVKDGKIVKVEGEPSHPIPSRVVLYARVVWRLRTSSIIPIASCIP